MRISFLGKGGSGKTTIASAFILHLARVRKQAVLAIDADINMHLQSSLGLQGKPLLLGDRFDEVLSYVRGTRTDLSTYPKIGTIPPTRASQFITPLPQDPFLRSFALQQGMLSLLTIGTYHGHEIGTSCYHTKLNSLELIYHHLLDERDEWVVADATAGIDQLATSLFACPDLTIFVVEPTEKSVGVYRQFIQAVSSSRLDYPVRTAVIMNKVADEQDRKFLEARIEPEQILGVINTDSRIRRSEQGDEEALNEFVRDSEPLFAVIVAKTATINRDDERVLALVKTLYRAECRNWANALFKGSFDALEDPNFSYAEARAKRLRMYEK